MDFDEINETSLSISEKEENNVNLEDYIFTTLGLDKNTIEKPELFVQNFSHLMCHLYKDIKEIEDRLLDYKSRYTALQGLKTNKAKFERRKLSYFCDLNKRALDEINRFVAYEIPTFLSEHRYNTLERELKEDGVSELFYKRRYKYAWQRDYYSIDYPYDAIVKISQYVREKYQLDLVMEEENRLLQCYKDTPEQFFLGG